MLKQNTGIASILILCALASLGYSRPAGANDFQRLLPGTCIPLASSKLNVALASQWQPYLLSTRVCPLVKKRGAKPGIVLISISAEDYYRDKPDGAIWENFPKPLLFNDKGEHVGELKALFPDDLPSEVILTYGHWQGNIPCEIRTHIIAHTVVSNYNLPTLLWSKEKQRYVEQAE